MAAERLRNLLFVFGVSLITSGALASPRSVYEEAEAAMRAGVCKRLVVLTPKDEEFENCVAASKCQEAGDECPKLQRKCDEETTWASGITSEWLKYTFACEAAGRL
jgi:hypothetical protein